MILTLARTGGFAGIRDLLGTVDTTGLDGEAQQALAARLKALASLASTPASPGADLFRYEVTIQAQGQPTQTLTIEDDGEAANPGMQALADLAALLGLPFP